MRVVIFFDLPMLTKKDTRQYTKFRKYLISQGFIMIQKSVYSKIALNGTASNAVIDNLKKNLPETGLVQILVITEKQYQSMEFLVGEGQKETIDTQQRLVIL
ncbi:CRISPR-associated endoribonuclease Cas2 [Methanimicrococcus stummii]|uniref:CRISPR-associated endoribonuclease Cas2 n=1 Tax=Methanimicrococcus stummii TaxID=3028294 RepID=A0AA96V8I0_9EURY|nr:CRISPR-associated endonuclease Cas2 [Methanimicrococcus sp. Es2]WNY28544.1 CRISPR-associated endoribonuclease Cas2 [Methanimicrococcus sp. Es2]